MLNRIIKSFCLHHSYIFIFNFNISSIIKLTMIQDISKNINSYIYPYVYIEYMKI